MILNNLEISAKTDYEKVIYFITGQLEDCVINTKTSFHFCLSISAPKNLQEMGLVLQTPETNVTQK